jgi:phosphoglycerate-specific signal transduction histidine kinase
MKMNLDIYKDEFNNVMLESVYQTFQTEIIHLNKLSNEIKQYSRPTEIIPSKINIFLFFESIKEQLSKKLKHKQITFINNTSDYSIISDYLKLQTAFLSLLNSSIDSMDNDSIIEITSKLLDDTGKLSIIINNNGDNAFNINPIFNPYDINKISGSGLGLLIFQQLIIDMGGSIHLLPSDNEETRIEIQLSCELNG